MLIASPSYVSYSSIFEHWFCSYVLFVVYHICCIVRFTNAVRLGRKWNGIIKNLIDRLLIILMISSFNETSNSDILKEPIRFWMMQFPTKLKSFEWEEEDFLWEHPCISKVIIFQTYILYILRNTSTKIETKIETLFSFIVFAFNVPLPLN